MLAWLLAVSYLFTASPIIGAPGLSIETAVPNDILIVIFSKLGFADLYQFSYVAKGCRSLSDQAVGSFYCFRWNGETFLHYTLLLHELDRLVHDARKCSDMGKLDTALGSSPHFR